MKTKLLKISELTFDPDLYPRIKVGWLTAYQYAQAMKTGSVFPPIIVGVLKRKHYVIDGWHRIEARKMLKEEYIEALLRNFTDKKEMFVQAVRLNTTHGRQLSVHEKVRIFQKLKDLKFSLQEISKIVQIPIEKIEVFQSRIVKGPNGKPIYLKSATAKAGISKGIDQESVSVRSVEHLLGQLIQLLGSDEFTMTDKMKEIAVQAYSLLGEKLELTIETS